MYKVLLDIEASQIKVDGNSSYPNMSVNNLLGLWRSKEYRGFRFGMSEPGFSTLGRSKRRFSNKSRVICQLYGKLRHVVL